jgi:hypothetical protein
VDELDDARQVGLGGLADPGFRHSAGR